MTRVLRMLAVVLVMGPTAALAQTPAPVALPPGVFAAERDIALATAGTYALDEAHTAVIVRVPISVIRRACSASIARRARLPGIPPPSRSRSSLPRSTRPPSPTNVKGFADDLTGDNFLKAKAFPEATFVSTAFKPTDKTRGKVEGQFTLMGKTKPLTFDVELGGAGKGFDNKPRIGVHAVATINPQDYGLPPFFTDPIQIQIDTEFEKNP